MDLDFFAQSAHISHEVAAIKGHIDTGLYCVAPTNAGKQFMDIWLQDLSGWEQSVAQDMLRDQTVPELTFRVLPMRLAMTSCLLVGALAAGDLDLAADSYAGRLSGSCCTTKTCL